MHQMIIKSSIPTITYLRKFAIWREQLPEEGVLMLTGYGCIGLFLGSLLEGKIRADPRPNEEFKEYDDRLYFAINERRLNGTRRCFLSAENIRLFNSFLRNHLREILMDRIEANSAIKINEADTIKIFIHELDIVDDISFDALKKGIQRYRKSKISAGILIS